jgi:hypothetical protein
MQIRDRQTLDAVADVATILATAYQRYRRGASKSLPKMLRKPSTKNLITGARRALMFMRLTREETPSKPDR